MKARPKRSGGRDAKGKSPSSEASNAGQKMGAASAKGPELDISRYTGKYDISKLHGLTTAGSSSTSKGSTERRKDDQDDDKSDKQSKSSSSSGPATASDSSVRSERYKKPRNYEKEFKWRKRRGGPEALTLQALSSTGKQPPEWPEDCVPEYEGRTAGTTDLKHFSIGRQDRLAVNEAIWPSGSGTSGSSAKGKEAVRPSGQIKEVASNSSDEGRRTVGREVAIQQARPEFLSLGGSKPSKPTLTDVKPKDKGSNGKGKSAGHTAVKAQRAKPKMIYVRRKTFGKGKLDKIEEDERGEGSLKAHGIR